MKARLISEILSVSNYIVIIVVILWYTTYTVDLSRLF